MKSSKVLTNTIDASLKNFRKSYSCTLLELHPHPFYKYVFYPKTWISVIRQSGLGLEPVSAFSWPNEWTKCFPGYFAVLYHSNALPKCIHSEVYDETDKTSNMRLPEFITAPLASPRVGNEGNSISKLTIFNLIQVPLPRAEERIVCM